MESYLFSRCGSPTAGNEDSCTPAIREEQLFREIGVVTVVIGLVPINVLSKSFFYFHNGVIIQQSLHRFRRRNLAVQFVAHTCELRDIRTKFSLPEPLTFLLSYLWCFS